MMSRRPPSDGDSSRPAALPAACRSLGTQLSDARATRGLSVDDVATRLLFSRRQVLGLERADPSPFYTHAYFLKAMRKYLAFCDLPADALDESPAPESACEELRLTLAADPESPPAAGPSPSRSRAWMGLAAGVVLAVAIGGAWWATSRGPAAVLPAGGPTPAPVDDATPLPASPLLLAAAAPLPVTAEPAQRTLDEASGAAVRISVGKPTWVFVRYPDNQVLERRLDAGEALEVSALPVYLAVGTADAVEVLIEDRPVALDPYIRSGQVRIGRSQLAALGALGARQ